MLNQEEKAFYRELYKLVIDPKFSDFLVKYAKLEYNKGLKKLRNKQDLYDNAHTNGYLDAFQHMIDLKQRITEVMRNIEG